MTNEEKVTPGFQRVADVASRLPAETAIPEPKRPAVAQDGEQETWVPVYMERAIYENALYRWQNEAISQRRDLITMRAQHEMESSLPEGSDGVQSWAHGVFERQIMRRIEAKHAENDRLRKEVDQAKEQLQVTLEMLYASYSVENFNKERTRAERAEASNAKLLETLAWVINDVQDWCDSVEGDSSWDGWDSHYKSFAYGGLDKARAAIQSAEARKK